MDTPSKLNIAIVGCGAITDLYYAPALKALSKSAGLCVSALVDPSRTRIEIVGSHFPAAEKVDSIGALRSGPLDLAIVASPQKFHAEQTIALLDLGIHVLCEKPMSSSLAEGREMVATSKRGRRLLAVGLFRRFFPSSRFIHGLVEEGALGRPVSFEWVEGGPFGWPAASPSFFQKSASQGGVFADVGAHVIDLLLWWFGEPVELDYEDDAMGGLEANARLQLRFSSGVTGTIRLSRDTQIPNGTRIQFERGSIWFQAASADSVVVQLDGCNYLTKGALHAIPSPNQGVGDGFGPEARTYAQSFMEQILNLCRAIRGEETIEVSGEQALRGMELIEHCYASRRLMSMPWLTPRESVGIARLFAGNSSLTS